MKVARGGFRVFEVPVSYFARSRAEGKKIRLKDGFSALGALVRHSLGPRSAKREPRARSRRPALAALALAASGSSGITRGATPCRPTSRSTSSRATSRSSAATRSSTSSIRRSMKMLAGLGLATLPLPPPPAQVPLGDALHRLRARVPLREPGLARRDRGGGAAPVPGGCWRAARGPRLLPPRAGGTAPGPALFAVALSCAFDPNLIAHAGVVHTDLGAALGFLATVLAWDRALARAVGRARRRWPALALGLALATKFSAVYLLPILAAPGAPRGAAGGAAGPRRARAARPARRASLAGALAVVFAVYAAVTSRMDRGEQRQVIHEMVAGRGAPGLSRAIERVARRLAAARRTTSAASPSVARQNADRRRRQLPRGKVSVDGLPGLLLRGVPREELARVPRGDGAARSAELAAVRLARDDAALLPPAGRGALPRVDRLELQHRHPPPAAGLSVPRDRPPRPSLARVARRGPAAGAVAAVAARRALPARRRRPRARPDPPARAVVLQPVRRRARSAGAKILSDSNVDWGLDLRRLADELRRRGVARSDGRLFRRRRRPLPHRRARLLRRSRACGGASSRSRRFTWRSVPQYYRYHGAMERRRGAREALRRDLAARGRPVGPRRILDLSVRAARPGGNRPDEAVRRDARLQRVEDDPRDRAPGARRCPIEKEILIVDDGSTDGTREILRELDGQRRRPRLPPAAQPGQGRGGLGRLPPRDRRRRRRPGRGPRVRPAASTSKLLGPIVDGHADVVYGSRFLGGGARRVLYFWHTVGNRFLTLASNMFTNLNLTDMETCYKMFRREVVQSMTIESRALRHRAGDHGQGRAARLPRSSRCRSPTTAGPTRKARRSAEGRVLRALDDRAARASARPRTRATSATSRSRAWRSSSPTTAGSSDRFSPRARPARSSRSAPASAT